MEEWQFEKIVENLMNMDDMVWGEYIFAREPLRARIPHAEREEMIRQALECGRQKAVELQQRYGAITAKKLAEKLQLSVIYEDTVQAADRILFALFTPPSTIRIMKEPLKKLAECSMTARLIPSEAAADLILGHEIYHYLEEEDSSIYTRSKRIPLWHLFGYTCTSVVRALSETGAAAFTRSINGGKFPPFVIDCVLYYLYDEYRAVQLYKEITALTSDACSRR